MHCVTILANGDNWCCQMEQDKSRQYANGGETELESHRGQPRPDQDSSSYVNMPEEPPHRHTELLDENGYSRTVCDHDNERTKSRQYDNVDPTELESHRESPRPQPDPSLTVHDSSPYTNVPQDQPHGHTELLDEHGYSLAVCDNDNERTRSRQYDNVSGTEPESHRGQPRHQHDALVNVHDSSSYANIPEEPPHSHSELFDEHGYSRAVCNDDKCNITETHL